MPTYDYECDACGHTFEQFQGINDPHLTKCPACRKAKLRRLIGAGAAVVFKGSGFYQTDYRSESYKKKAAAEKSEGGSASSSSGDSNGSAGKGGESKAAESKASPKSSEAGAKSGDKPKKAKD